MRFLFQILVVFLLIGVGVGFWTDRRQREDARARIEAEKKAAEEDLFRPDLIDPAGVEDYFEAQWDTLLVLVSAVGRYSFERDTIPQGSDWQHVLVSAGFLDTPMLPPPLPRNITWNRTRPPAPELTPRRDADGVIRLTLSAGGIDLATFGNGEISAIAPPIPPDAALPPDYAK